MRLAELKALARERGLRGYSWLRKAELIVLLQNNHPPPLRSGVPPWSGALLGPPPPAPHTRPPRPTRAPPPPPPSVRFRPDRLKQPELMSQLEIKGSKELTHGSACRKSQSTLKWGKKQ